MCIIDCFPNANNSSLFGVALSMQSISLKMLRMLYVWTRSVTAIRLVIYSLAQNQLATYSLFEKRILEIRFNCKSTGIGESKMLAVFWKCVWLRDFAVVSTVCFNYSFDYLVSLYAQCIFGVECGKGKR